MSKTSDKIAELEEFLEKSDLDWMLVYDPETETYLVRIRKKTHGGKENG